MLNLDEKEIGNEGQNRCFDKDFMIRDEQFQCKYWRNVTFLSSVSPLKHWLHWHRFHRRSVSVSLSLTDRDTECRWNQCQCSSERFTETAHPYLYRYIHIWQRRKEFCSRIFVKFGNTKACQVVTGVLILQKPLMISIWQQDIDNHYRISAVTKTLNQDNESVWCMLRVCRIYSMSIPVEWFLQY